MKKLLSSAVAIASVIGVCALPTQVSAGADGSKDILGIAGSDTTTFVMEALASAHNTNSRYNHDKDRAVNIPPLLAANPSVEAGEGASSAASANKAWLAGARSTWPGGIVLPADNDCQVNMVFGGYGSRDIAADSNNSALDGDTNDGALSGGLAAEGGIKVERDLSVPADGDTSDVGETWYLGLVPPNGSSSGRGAIRGGSIQNGVWYNGTNSPSTSGLTPANRACLDIARSSSKESDETQMPKMEGWAFALDAIDWTYFGGNTHGVAQTGLTRVQLGKIYTCLSTAEATAAARDAGVVGVPDVVGDRVAGYPEFSLWGDVTGNATDTTPIKAYRVQIGSGTGDDVATTLIGKSSSIKNGANFTQNCLGYDFPQVQEHDCRSVSDANKPHAICFYGYSRWVIQAKALETDKRNGAVFGKFGISDLKRPSFSSINETSARFAGTRYVYNYVGLNTDGTGNDLPRIEDSRRFVGVTAQPAACNTNATGPVGNQVVSEVTAATDCNFDGDLTDASVAVGGVPGFICGDLTARKVIATYGLKPLPMGATDPANGALGQSYCRKATGSNPGF